MFSCVWISLQVYLRIPVITVPWQVQIARPHNSNSLQAPKHAIIARVIRFSRVLVTYRIHERLQSHWSRSRPFGYQWTIGIYRPVFRDPRSSSWYLHAYLYTDSMGREEIDTGNYFHERNQFLKCWNIVEPIGGVYF